MIDAVSADLRNLTVAQQVILVSDQQNRKQVSRYGLIKTMSPIFGQSQSKFSKQAAKKDISSTSKDIEFVI